MNEEESMIRLISPNAKSDEFVFYWQQNAKVANEENKYIVNTIYWVIHDVEELSNDKELLNLLDNVDIKSYSSVKELAEAFNKKLCLVKEEWSKNKTTPFFLNRKASKRHLHHIIDYCYTKAVDDPDKLNQYIPFSAEVYGETSFELVDQIIEWVKFKPDDVFIDLGSGVGQVVLQVAAATNCKSCSGIEKADYPAKCAVTLEQEFRRLMTYFGKPFNHFTLIKGDFLADEFQDNISASTVIFANNFAFGPVVDHQLKNRFTSLKEGAKIISSKAFCPLKFRITDRNLDDIGSIMRVTSLNAMEDAVSWTCSAFSYYLHQVDHSMLEEYFAKYKLRSKDSGSASAAETTPSKSIASNGNSQTNIYMNEEDNDSEEMKHPLSRSASVNDNIKTRQHHQHHHHSHHSHHHHHHHSHAVRRASERLLRNSRRFGVSSTPSGIVSDSNSGRHSTGGVTASGLLKREQLTAANSRATSVSASNKSSNNTSSCSKRGRRRKNSNLVGHGKLIKMSSKSTKSNDENAHPKAPSRSQSSMSGESCIEKLHRATMATINGGNAMPSYNSEGSMSRFVNQYKAHEMDDMKAALAFLHASKDNVNLSHSEEVVPLAIHQYLELLRHKMMHQLRTMQSTDYRESVLTEINEQLRVRDHLSASIRELEEVQIPRLHKLGVGLLSQHLARLGIRADSPSAFFLEARKLIREQSRVEAENSRMKTEISELVTCQRRIKERIRELDQQNHHHYQPQPQSQLPPQSQHQHNHHYQHQQQYQQQHQQQHQHQQHQQQQQYQHQHQHQHQGVLEQIIRVMMPNGGSNVSHIPAAATGIVDDISNGNCAIIEAVLSGNAPPNLTRYSPISRSSTPLNSFPTTNAAGGGGGGATTVSDGIITMTAELSNGQQH